MKKTSQPKKKTAEQPRVDNNKLKKYNLRALGYCVEATAHKLSAEEAAAVEEWCESEGCATDEISGSGEEFLPDYDCYSTNLWQSGIVPVVSSVRLMLLDCEDNEILSIDKPWTFGTEGGGGDALRVDRGEGNVLVYFEESKGLVAAWGLEATEVPSAADFTVETNKIVVDGDETEFISEIRFLGKKLERDYDQEDITGKAAYSFLL